MIIVNGLKFATSQTEFDSTQCAGFYNVASGVLMDGEQNIRAVVVDNRHGAFFASASRRWQGIFYSQALSSLDMIWLGLDCVPYSKHSAIAHDVIAQAIAQNVIV